MLQDSQDTIVAIATPAGRGGVGILRLSGSMALDIAKRITHNNDFSINSNKFVTFYKDNTAIDNGLVLYFKAPKSFTGEDVIELQAHGSPIVLEELVSLSVTYGARVANPGEFSQRAFLNNKIDLTQAEAIADLINAQSSYAAKLAMESLQGVFSQEINKLNDKILNLRLNIEAHIDFPDEDIHALQGVKICDEIEGILKQIYQIIYKAKQGAIIQDGLNVVICGPPNSGKSTLINQLSGKNVAIVTPIAGTTRDIIEVPITLGNISLKVTDTAGFRDTTDFVEQEGINRARSALDLADLILWVQDINAKANKYAQKILELQNSTPVIFIKNKVDLADNKIFTKDKEIFLSAKTGAGIDLLVKAIQNLVAIAPENEGIFLARKRHILCLEKVAVELETAIELLKINNMHNIELIAQDLYIAHNILGEITGRVTCDDLLGHIFTSFCIGK